MVQQPSSTIITLNNDNTTTITTNNIDVTTTEVKTVLQTLTQNSIQVSATQITSLQYTESPKTIEYVAVIQDSNGSPYKQVTLLTDKTTQVTIITDETSLIQEVTITRPKLPSIQVVPVSDYYKPEVKEIINQVETTVSANFSISKITKIEYTNTTEATKFQFVAESTKGHPVYITAIQNKGDSTVQVISVQSEITTLSVDTTQT